MSDISRPLVTDDDPDRHIRCQDALQFAFRDLIEAAVAAGWNEREALAAVGELADNHLLALAANDDTAALLDVLRKMSCLSLQREHNKNNGDAAACWTIREKENGYAPAAEQESIGSRHLLDPPCEIDASNAHPRLLAALKAGADIEQMRHFVAGAYDMGSGAPMGQLEVAMDCNRGLACGVFRSIINGEDTSGKPAWFACDNDPDNSIKTVLCSATAEGLVL